MEIEPKPVITPVSDASLMLEPVLGRETAPACQCQPNGRGFLKGPLLKGTSWPGLRSLTGRQLTNTQPSSWQLQRGGKPTHPPPQPLNGIQTSDLTRTVHSTLGWVEVPCGHCPCQEQLLRGCRGRCLPQHWCSLLSLCMGPLPSHSCFLLSWEAPGMA